MTVKLVYKVENGLTEEKQFDTSVISVGRSISNTLNLDDPNISRRHFVLEFIDHHWSIYDNNSKHGTLLNNVFLLPNERQIINTGEQIKINNIIIDFFYDNISPKPEHTRILAQKMFDEILNNPMEEKEIKNNSNDQILTKKEINNYVSKNKKFNDVKYFTTALVIYFFSVAFYCYKYL